MSTKAEKAPDPYYTRKQIPKELIKDIGITGLTPEEEYETRERKLSTATGSDLRHFSDTINKKDDPYYHRKQVPKHLTKGVGDTGLTPEQEYETRERKLSTAYGGDLRHFSDTINKKDDPYYHRKQVPKTLTKGVGETNIDPVEEYETRERKLSVFKLGNDPFDITVGRRSSTAVPDEQSVLGTGRRRSSAVAPHITHEEHNEHHGIRHTHNTGHTLEPIQSRAEEPPITNGGAVPPLITPATPAFASAPRGADEHIESHPTLIHEVVTNP